MPHDGGIVVFNPASRAVLYVDAAALGACWGPSGMTSRWPMSTS